MRVSAKRLFPNFSFQDAPYNLQYYKEGHPETEIAYMGCRTRVIGNVYDKTREISNGRGNLSFTSINLPRIAIKANHNIDQFFTELDRLITLVIDQLFDRFEIQARKMCIRDSGECAARCVSRRAMGRISGQRFRPVRRGTRLRPGRRAAIPQKELGVNLRNAG